MCVKDCRSGAYPEATIKVRCTAPSEVFAVCYDDVPEQYRRVIEGQGGLPCAGDGVPGAWCLSHMLFGCFWAIVSDVTLRYYRDEATPGQEMWTHHNYVGAVAQQNQKIPQTSS